ncbi:HVA22-like protein k isoform X2 [Tripterygium wilfordii]|uniref:HVA22-like protein k isoform X2 n=1 Tax=Tripterygium wilfordii TaxID=458696 RepID=UPI0018F81D45|nr:HVA22-like protein k isoform X2 [Tripterygium wilfordii]
MAFPGEVGLQLLLSPLGSNVVVRTACLHIDLWLMIPCSLKSLCCSILCIRSCCTVGLVLPVYSTFKAIENKDQNEQQKWLFYWAAYGSFSIAEVFTDKLLSWFPLYYHVKFAFLVWLQLPSINGARQLYMSHLRPFLLRHQARLDQIVDLVYSEMGKFVSKHQSEIQFASALSIKILRSVREIVHPRQTQIHGTIEGPRRQIQDAPPDDDDDDVEE